MADITATQPARPKKRKPETRNFCLRFTDDERQRLTERAGRVPLGTFIRAVLLDEGETMKRRRTSSPRRDDTVLARVLAALGQSRLSNNLNQLAKAANMGALPVTPETEHEIVSACAAVTAMRQDLLLALGLSGEQRP